MILPDFSAHLVTYAPNATHTRPSLLDMAKLEDVDIHGLTMQGHEVHFSPCASLYNAESGLYWVRIVLRNAEMAPEVPLHAVPFTLAPR